MILFDFVQILSMCDDQDRLSKLLDMVSGILSVEAVQDVYLTGDSVDVKSLHIFS